MSIQEKLENLKKQKKEYEQMFFKCLGAIEVLTEMLNEETKSRKDK